MRTHHKASIALLVLILISAATILVVQRLYPNGYRPCCLPCMIQALRTYASDHGGAFPDAPQGARQALRSLYPQYLPDPAPIAGLGGNRELLKRQLAHGTELTEAATTWVYCRGLRLGDNPEIALIWDSQRGVGFNGRREAGHAVGFIAGNMRQVADSDWDRFLVDQQSLRQVAITSRTNRQD